MNALTLRCCLALLATVVALPAFGHDPKEHEKEAAAAKAGPDCAKLKTADMSTMDKNDPVLLALQAKCAKANASHDDNHDHDHAKDEKKDPAPTDAAGGH